MKNCVRLVGDRLRPLCHYIWGLRIVFLLGALGLSCFADRLSAQIQPVPDPARIVVLANSKDPQSLQLAQYYAQKRAIPSTHVLAPRSVQRRPSIGMITLRACIIHCWLSAKSGGGCAAYSARSQMSRDAIICRWPCLQWITWFACVAFPFG